MFRSRETTAGPSPPSTTTNSSTAVRCAGWPIGSRLRAANIHAVLVARGGKLVFERYFRGSDEIPAHFGRRVENVAFDADTLHDMKSVSKSVASLAVGIAIDRGLIRSVDEPIFSFFPELRTCVPRKRTASCCGTRSP